MIEIYTIVIIIIGITQVYKTKEWLFYYSWIENNGIKGIRVHSFINFSIGLPIIIFINDLSGPQNILYFFAWFLVLEGLFSLMSVKLITREFSGMDKIILAKFIIFSGVIHLVIGGILVMDIMYN
tara:strand:- start:114 stop:488 length:375 start_codon:yes stop_codon:yes gene_type:complete